MKTATSFLAHNPTLLDSLKARKFGSYRFYECTIHGDEGPIYMTTPSGFVVSTCYYDLEDLDLESCENFTADHTYRLIGQLRDKRERAENKEDSTTARLVSLIIWRKLHGINRAAKMSEGFTV
jgi:hypothetical protein